MRYTLITATISDRYSKWCECYISKNILTRNEATMKMMNLVDNFNAEQKEGKPLRSLVSVDIKYPYEI